MKLSAGVLRIGVDARLTSGPSGGVEQVIIGLASGLLKTCRCEARRFKAFR